MKEIKLTNSEQVTFVDDQDYVNVAGFAWMLSKDGYAMHWTPEGFVYLHQLIIGTAPQGKVTDHKNRIKLDNHRGNLHHVTHAQNMQNKLRTSSGFLGVFWVKEKQKFRVRIKKDGVIYNLGYYKDATSGARAYDTKAVELYGASATLNFPLHTSQELV